MDEYERTDRTLLRHLARYGMGVTRLLGELTPRGDANNSLVRLRNLKLVEYYTQNLGKDFLLPHGISWAMPTKAGCEQAGVPVDRAESLSSVALHQRLAVFWHAVTTGAVKLETLQVETLTGWKPPGNVSFILSEKTLLRVYVANSEERITLNATWKIADELIDRIPHFRARLGVLVLAPSKQKCSAIQIALAEAKRQPPLPVSVRLGPSPDTLHDYLEERRSRGNPNGD